MNLYCFLSLPTFSFCTRRKCVHRDGCGGWGVERRHLFAKNSRETMACVHGKALGCGRHCNSLSWLLNSVSVYLHEPMSHESENKATASVNSLLFG